MTTPSPARERAKALADRWGLDAVDGAVCEILATKPLTIACSGGADSIALCLWLLGHFPEYVRRIVHVHHGLRGAEADADAAFVEELAASLGIPSRILRVTPVDASEGALREARLAALRSVAESDGAIVFGHHANDVLENLLFRLVRGSSLAALAGMRALRSFGKGVPMHLRPFLRRTREEIRETLRALGQAWREDTSNATEAYTRNALRGSVVPALENVFPGRDLTEAALRLHGELGEFEQWFDGLIEEAACGFSNALPCDFREDWPPSLRRRLLLRWLAGQGIPSPRRALLDQILAAGSPKHGAWDLDAEHRLIAENGIWRVEGTDADPEESNAAWPSRRIGPGESVSFPTGAILRVEICVLDETRRAAILSGAVDPRSEVFLAASGSVPEALQVRRWQTGDRYVPLGAPGSRKLQDCFVDRGIPREERSRLPVITEENGRILWVPGLEPAQHRILTAETTRALWLTYQQC